MRNNAVQGTTIPHMYVMSSLLVPEAALFMLRADTVTAMRCMLAASCERPGPFKTKYRDITTVPR